MKHTMTVIQFKFIFVLFTIINNFTFISFLSPGKMSVFATATGTGGTGASGVVPVVGFFYERFFCHDNINIFVIIFLIVVC